MNAARLPWASAKMVKFVLNSCIGENEDALGIARVKLRELTGYDPTPVRAKTTVKKFGIRRGRLIGYKHVFYGKMARAIMSKVMHTCPGRARINRRGLSWGIREYSMISCLKYNPMRPQFGMDFNAVIAGMGHRVKCRARNRGKFKNWATPDAIWACASAIA